MENRSVNIFHYLWQNLMNVYNISLYLALQNVISTNVRKPDLSLTGCDITQGLTGIVNPVTQSVHALLEMTVWHQSALVLDLCVCLQTALHLTHLIEQFTAHLKTHIHSQWHNITMPTCQVGPKIPWQPWLQMRHSFCVKLPFIT